MFKFLSIAILTCIQCISANPHYIVGNLAGDLGNQMFIVAATYAHALDHGATPVFPDFNTKTTHNIPIHREKIFFRLNTFNPPLQNTTLYNEDINFNYIKIPFLGDMILSGYFQSEKYFKHHKEKIIDLFEPSDEIKQKIVNKYGKILQHPKTVAVHLRSYLPEDEKYHPFATWDYVLRAIQEFDEDSLFLILSDKINICKKSIPKLINRNFVFIEHNSHLIDFYLQTMCKHNITTNSSFSWWGAYLNKNPEKKVVCPSYKNWVGELYSHLNMIDVPCPEWTQLPCNNLNVRMEPL
ncbi:MAG: alpha-1,2-fucosyltransferase [Chlamydiia bacterium]